MAKPVQSLEQWEIELIRQALDLYIKSWERKINSPTMPDNVRQACLQEKLRLEVIKAKITT